MSEPLTDAEVAELRRLQHAVDEDTHHVDNGAENARDDAAGAALPRLLDELALLRRRDREQTAGEEVLRQQVRDAERRIEMLRVELGQRGR